MNPGISSAAKDSRMHPLILGFCAPHEKEPTKWDRHVTGQQMCTKWAATPELRHSKKSICRLLFDGWTEFKNYKCNQTNDFILKGGKWKYHQFDRAITLVFTGRFATDYPTSFKWNQ